MVFHKPDFCRGVAMVLQGESLRAGCYVNHNASLGGLREKIVRRFIRDQTPGRFQVETGLIHNTESGETSRQCDILIHESANHAPLYRWEDFVVVQRREATAVVEVKTTLDEKGFGDLLNIQRSLVSVMGPPSNHIPTFGFALEGVSFSSFVGYLQVAVQNNALNEEGDNRAFNWPVCVMVQDKHYLGVRPVQRMAESGARIGLPSFLVRMGVRG